MEPQTQAKHVMTIANSIIGVSIIAMPYCFKQCGIVLSTIILIVSSIISRLSCHLLLKSAILVRRRTFEFLAFHAFGSLGKFVIEIGLIGFLLGTCIAFFVVMGDLGPSIVVKMTGTKETNTLRTSILMALALFCVLPLGLLRNIDSLTSVCTATVGFYFCLVLKIIVQSIPYLFYGDWINHVELFRPAGFLQCLPIFSMALFCQTQIFEIYQAIPNVSLEKMNDLIRKAVNICTGVYISVGVFGYITFCKENFTGNILMSFPSSLMTEVIKFGFVLSVAFSFPLIIFPCRASLYSLLYRRTYALHEGITDKYIPELRFKTLTFSIVLVSLVIGVMIPNIEFVLGLVGSTIGIMICVIFPAMCFICVSSKNTNERILAQLMLFSGIIIMVLGTYANLYAMEGGAVKAVVVEKVIKKSEIINISELPQFKEVHILKTIAALKSKNDIEVKKEIVKEIRHEPPQPEEPIEPVQSKNLPSIDQLNGETKLIDVLNKPSKKLAVIEDKIIAHQKETESPVLQESIKADVEQPKPQVKEKVKALIKETLKPETISFAPVEKTITTKKEISNKKRVEEVAKEAIEKEDKELMEQEKKLKEEEKVSLNLIKSLEKRNEEQKKLVEEKKQLLEEIKQRQQALEYEKQQREIDKEKLKAVEQIQEIAKKAIEKLSGDDEQKHVESIPSVNEQPLKRTSIKANTVEETKESETKLNKNNLVPLPIANVNNLSENSHNLPVGVVTNLSKILTEKTKLMGLQRLDEKKNVEAQFENAQNINLVNILKTKVGNRTNESLKKNDKEIQHREIRDVHNMDDLIVNIHDKHEDLQNKQTEPVPSVITNKHIYKANEESEQGCDITDSIKQTDLKIEASSAKVMSKLFNPEIVSVKVSNLDELDVDSNLKPLNRDLKSYTLRKK